MNDEIVEEKIWFVESDDKEQEEGYRALVQIQKCLVLNGTRSFTICKIIKRKTDSIKIKSVSLRFDLTSGIFPAKDFDCSCNIRDLVFRKVRDEYKGNLFIKELETDKILVDLYFLKLQGDICGNVIRALKPSKYDGGVFERIEYLDRTIWNEQEQPLYQ